MKFTTRTVICRWVCDVCGKVYLQTSETDSKMEAQAFDPPSPLLEVGACVNGSAISGSARVERKSSAYLQCCPDGCISVALADVTERLRGSLQRDEEGRLLPEEEKE